MSKNIEHHKSVANTPDRADRYDRLLVPIDAKKQRLKLLLEEQTAVLWLIEIFIALIILECTTRSSTPTKTRRRTIVSIMIVNRPRCQEMCEGKAFLLSRASFSNSTKEETYETPRFIEDAKHNIEVHQGAKAAAGLSGKYIREAGFISNQPLGLDQLVQTNDLLRHHGQDKNLMDISHDFWIDALTEYAEATKYGILIMAIKPEFLQIWASASVSLKEIKDIPNGRVHVYIEDDDEEEFFVNPQHGEDDRRDTTSSSKEGRRRQGYILHMDANGTFESSSSSTVTNGNGVMIFGRRGGYYRGQIQDCKAHGKGKLVRPSNGEIYEGDFQYNKQHGKGTQWFVNGDVYSGDWIANKCHGMGKLSWINGDIYEGEFKESKPDGKGAFNFANGDIYVGDFVKGKINGRGKYRWSDNGEVYEGGYNNARFHGQGKYFYANGNVYEGEFKEGLYHGIGMLTWATGNSCGGTWEAGRFLGG